MSKRYDFRDRIPPLSSEEITRHKDFDALLQAFEGGRKPEAPVRRLRPWVVAAAAAAALLAGYLLWWPSPGTSYEQLAEAFFSSRPFIAPPLPELEPPSEVVTVNAEQGGVYEFSSGSRIVVPTAAFRDDKGRLVEGEIQLHFRELLDPVDFFLAGIPMGYDSAGTHYLLESAGMLEVYATQNGQRVSLAPDKELLVELVGRVLVPADQTEPPPYNVYYLDPAEGNWVYRGTNRTKWFGSASDADDEPEIQSLMQEREEQLQTLYRQKTEALEELERRVPPPPKPRAPQRADRNALVFELDLSEMQGADEELLAFKREFQGMLWQLAPGQNLSDQDLVAPDGSWDDMRLNPIDELEYELVLIDKEVERKVRVRPVLTGEDFDKAQQAFQSKMQTWQRQMEERQARIEQERAALEAEFAARQAALEKELDERIARLRAQGLDYAANRAIIQRKVLNTFRVTSLGIWNYDKPLSPILARNTVRFKDQHGRLLDNTQGWLVNKNLNTVNRFFVSAKGTPLIINEPEGEHLLWILTSENKIALLPPERFRTWFEAPERQPELVLTLVDEPLDSEADIRRILNL
ncbi:MAG: hypothetical protein D6765_17420 [Bacteroidetes bacterium]|nr:MAG: hypothetical protein D6765_17420 [Bacteroidota bacterium]